MGRTLVDLYNECCLAKGAMGFETKDVVTLFIQN